jgi:hypothetical protein
MSEPTSELLPLAAILYEAYQVAQYGRSNRPLTDCDLGYRKLWIAVAEATRTNRWHAFSTEELGILDYYLDIEVENTPIQARLAMVEQIASRVSAPRRQGGEVSEESKDCPFCGKDNISEADPRHVWCEDCAIQVHKKDWNNRPIEDKLRGLLKEYADYVNGVFSPGVEGSVNWHKWKLGIDYRTQEALK